MKSQPRWNEIPHSLKGNVAQDDVGRRRVNPLNVLMTRGRGISAGSGSRVAGGGNWWNSRVLISQKLFEVQVNSRGAFLAAESYALCATAYSTVVIYY